MFQSTPGGGGGGQAQPRELTYRVRVVADTSQASQAFQQMGGHAQRAAAYQQPAAYQQGHNPMAGGMAYSPAGWVPQGQPGGQQPGGGQDKNVGIAAGYAVMLSRLTVAVGFVTQAMEKFRGVVEAINLQGRETVNAQAKMEKWFEAVPLVGKPIGDFMSYGLALDQRYGDNEGFGYGAKATASGKTQLAQQAFTKSNRLAKGNPFNDFFNDNVLPYAAGVAGEFAAAEYEAVVAADRAFMTPYEMARAETRREGGRRADDLRDAREVSDATGRYRAQEARGLSKLMFAKDKDAAPFSPEVEAGVKAGWFPNLKRQSERTRFDADDQYDAVIRQAARAKVTAEAGGGMAQEEYDRAREAREKAKGEVTGRAAYDAAQKEVEKLKDRAKSDPRIQAGDIAIANSAAERTGAEYAAQLAKYQESINKEKEKSVSLAQAEFELAQKSLAVEQAKLSVVEAKLKANDGYAEAFAGLNGGQRQGLLDSARQLSEGDFDSLSPRQRELLAGNSATSEFYRKKAREFTNADPESRKQLDELARLTGQQTRTELLEQQRKLQAEIELKFTSNPEQLAEQLRKAFKMVDPELRKLIDEAIRVADGKTARQEAAGRAQK